MPVKLRGPANRRRRSNRHRHILAGAARLRSWRAVACPAGIGLLSARNRISRGIETMQQSARLMSAIPFGSLFCDCKELDRKLEAFRLFQYPDREIGFPVGRRSLEEDVRRALAQDAFRAIWILEGVGRIRAASAHCRPEGLLTGGPGPSVPESPWQG